MPFQSTLRSLREALAHSPLARLAALAGCAAFAALALLLALRLADARESASIEKALARLREKSREIPVSFDDGRVRRPDERTLSLEAPLPVVTMFLVEAEVACRRLDLTVTDANGRLAEWQWDYRWVRAERPGRHWLVTWVPFGMVQTPPLRLLLHFEPGCAKVDSLRMLEVASVDDWDGLPYNEDFFRDQDGLYRAKGTNGYRVMPDNLKFADILKN